MGKAYDGEMKTQNIKIGGQRMLFAPLGVSPISAKVTDVTTPPSGWRDAGALVEGSTELTTSKELFTLKSGLPESTKFQAIVGMEASVKTELHELTLQNFWEAMGRPPVKNTISAVEGTLIAGSTTEVIKLGSGEGASFSVLDIVVIDDDADTETSAELYVIESIDGDDITIFPKMANAPASGQKMKQVTAVAMGYGDTVIVKLQAAIIFDAKDGSQVVHYIPECALLGEYNPTLNKSKENVTLPLTLEAYGVYDSDLATTIVVKPLMFP